jgi:hypothetical protein
LIQLQEEIDAKLGKHEQLQYAMCFYQRWQSLLESELAAEKSKALGSHRTIFGQMLSNSIFTIFATNKLTDGTRNTSLATQPPTSCTAGQGQWYFCFQLVKSQNQSSQPNCQVSSLQMT